MENYTRILKKSQRCCPRSHLKIWGYLRIPSLSFSDPHATLILKNSRNSRMRTRIHENEVFSGNPIVNPSDPNFPFYFLLEIWGYLRIPSLLFSNPHATLILKNSRNSRIRTRIHENEVLSGNPIVNPFDPNFPFYTHTPF